MTSAVYRAVGVFALGGVSCGLAAVAGLARGWWAVGGGAIGYRAFGGLAAGATLTRAMGSPTATMKPVAGRKRDSLDKGARFYQR